jgi:hypothetical protein
MSKLANFGPRRGKGLLIGAGCIVANLLCVSTTSGATPPQEKESATALLHDAVTSAGREGSVRVTVHFFSGKTTGEIVQDSGRDSDVQTVAIGKERVSIVLLGGIAYFSGNAKGLASYFGLPSPAASSLAGHWISVSSTDSGYRSVTAGLTLSAALMEASPKGSLTEGKVKTIDSRQTRSIAGTASPNEAPTTLFVSLKGRPLPVEAVSATEIGETASGEIVDFSRWGEKVDVPKPSGAIPIATINSGSAAQG